MLAMFKKLFAYKWVTLLLIYFVLMCVSWSFQLLEDKQNFKNSSTPVSDGVSIVFIQDPVLSEHLNKKIFEREVFFVELNQSSIYQNVISINERLDSLSITNYHLVGEGIGGTVAMHIASDPLVKNKVQSLVLIDSNGIIELELMGSSFLNKAIYKSKNALFKLLIKGTPHFGRFNFLQSYIKKTEIQASSDLLHIRSIIPEIEVPVAILHTQAAKVSQQLANEHHRLLPQSKLATNLNTESLSATLSSFIEDVESGKAPGRSQVSMASQILALQPFDPLNSIKAEGKMLFILMLVIILSTFITEDLTCIGTGLLIAQGIIGFIPGTLACLIGIFIGDILLYLTGRWVASSTVHKAPFKWFISEKDLLLSYHWFEAKGPAIIIASRFIPGTRLPTYVSAGAIGANFFTFIIYFGIASILWTPILVGLSLLLGNEMIEYFSFYQEYALLVLIGLLIVLFVLIKVLLPSLTFKGRRLIIGKIRRLVNWEFWSPFMIYAPVVFYCSFLWMKYKSLTLVTLANPGIKFGGIMRESKSRILEAIQAKESIARFRLVEANSDALKLCKLFMEDQELVFPVVLKPDIGERGKGVFIPKNSTELKHCIAHYNEPFIIQEYIDGLEFGIFYALHPKQKKGTIISITRKEYLWLTGDGKHTLEELILQDERAVCLAKTHFEQHANHLFKVIPKGKKIKLVELGTHSRGAIFKDAIHLNSEKLLYKIDEIGKSFNGFHFGRFDIKVPDETHLTEGSNLKVLELNGITSEATHIYDPKYPYWYAVKTLCKQWKMAYEIANEVREMNKGLTPPKLSELFALLR